MTWPVCMPCGGACATSCLIIPHQLALLFFPRCDILPLWWNVRACRAGCRSPDSVAWCGNFGQDSVTDVSPIGMHNPVGLTSYTHPSGQFHSGCHRNQPRTCVRRRAGNSRTLPHSDWCAYDAMCVVTIDRHDITQFNAGGARHLATSEP